MSSKHAFKDANKPRAKPTCDRLTAFQIPGWSQKSRGTPAPPALSARQRFSRAQPVGFSYPSQRLSVKTFLEETAPPAQPTHVGVAAAVDPSGSSA